MCDTEIIQRLLETNEKMQRSNDRKFLALVVIYLLTVVGFFLYLTMAPISMRLEAKREPYEQDHEEPYINPTTGEAEVKTVSSPTIKRFFVIGDEPKPYVPTEDELKAQVRAVRDKYMQTTQNRIDRYRNQKELGIETTDTEEVFKRLLEYTQYLRDYPNGENWWVKNPMKFDKCVVTTSKLSV